MSGRYRLGISPAGASRRVPMRLSAWPIVVIAKLAVDLSAVPHFDYQDQQLLVLNSIDEPVVSRPDAI